VGLPIPIEGKVSAASFGGAVLAVLALSYLGIIPKLDDLRGLEHELYELRAELAETKAELASTRYWNRLASPDTLDAGPVPR
jgi:hypothetical protein